MMIKHKTSFVILFYFKTFWFSTYLIVIYLTICYSKRVEPITQCIRIQL